MALFGLFGKKKKRKKAEETSLPVKLDEKGEIEVVDGLPLEIVEAKPLPVDFPLTDYSLMEIDDPSLLERVQKHIPIFAKATSVVGKAAFSGKTYLAVLPPGAKLDSSTAIAGAFRGTIHGASGFSGAANFIPAGGITGIYSLAVSIAVRSLAKSITDEIGKVGKIVSKTLMFQKAEYHGKVGALLTSLNRILSFSGQIASNPELRNRELAKLESIEVVATSLLFEGHRLIEGIARKQDKKYKEYTEDAKDAANLLDYCFVLENILANIANVRYAFHLGEISREYSNYTLREALSKGDNAKELIQSWIDNENGFFAIDVEKARRRRTGIMGAATKVIDKAIKKEVEYIPLTEDAVSFFAELKAKPSRELSVDTSEVYQEDVLLLEKDEKVYFLKKVVEA